jgi:catechol 2,3-dioxygenase-like lactoylglutathione lyase family enzyme
MVTLDHINISAPMGLLQDVRDFYCSILEFREGYRPDFSSNGFWLYSDGKPVIHLSESDRQPPGKQPGCLDHVAFRASGLKAVLKRLDSINVEYRSNYVPDTGMSQVFFKDPAGVLIEINCLNDAPPAQGPPSP